MRDFNPEEVVEDSAMDWEWKNENESSVDGHLRNFREEMAEMLLRMERLDRALLGCEESGSSSGGGECAWWRFAWWVKTKMRMNSANRRKVHRAISQSLGKSSERNRVCEEKSSGTDDGPKRRQKLEKEVDLKRSWRARNEQASVEKSDDQFLEKTGGGRVRGHTWLFLWIPDPEQGCQVLLWNMLPRYSGCVSLNSPKLDL